MSAHHGKAVACSQQLVHAPCQHFTNKHTAGALPTHHKDHGLQLVHSLPALQLAPPSMRQVPHPPTMVTVTSSLCAYSASTGGSCAHHARMVCSHSLMDGAPMNTMPHRVMVAGEAVAMLSICGGGRGECSGLWALCRTG